MNYFQVIRHIETEDAEVFFEVFFIDYGIINVCSLENLLPLPKALLDRLPGQALRCCLSGILPFDETAGWKRKAGDLLCRLSDGGEKVFQATKIQKLIQV